MPLNPPLSADHDLNTLRFQVDAALRIDPTATLETLREKLDHAIATGSAGAPPPDEVTLGSVVRFEDIYTGEIEECTLTLPDQADIGACRLSVLSPVGAALFGAREGALVEWPTPGGIRRLKIHRVTPPVPAAAGA